MHVFRVRTSFSKLAAFTRNGKAVTAVIELQARFDEAANVRLADRLRSEDVEVIFGVPGLKVHSKVALILRRENGSAGR